MTIPPGAAGRNRTFSSDRDEKVFLCPQHVFPNAIGYRTVPHV